MVELNCTVPVVLDWMTPPGPPPSTCVLFTQSSHSLIVMRGPSFVGDRHSASAAEPQVSASPPVTASSCVSVRRTPLPAGAFSVACSTGLSAAPKAGVPVAHANNTTAIAHVRDFAFMAASLCTTFNFLYFGWFEAREMRRSKEWLSDRASNGRATKRNSRQAIDIVKEGVMTENFLHGPLFSLWTSGRNCSLGKHTLESFNGELEG